MEDTRKLSRKIGEFFIRRSHQPESFKMLRDRHQREIGEYQARCKHRSQTLWSPFWICTNCEKFIRKATSEELEAVHQLSQEELTTIIKENDVAYADK